MATLGARPNIIFYFSDQQRWDTVGCYGQSLPITPNLDRMAQEGVRFEHTFTCQPVCGPARSCLQTGKWATETGCFRNGIALPMEETTIAHLLSAEGYRVGYVGKWHLASTIGLPGQPHIDYQTAPIPMERRGGYVDYWVASDILEFTSHSYDGHMFGADMQRRDFAAGRYRADCVTDFALEFLRSHDRRRPFFLFVSFIEPHHQNDHNRYEGPVGSRERWANYEIPGDLANTAGDWRENYPDYLGCCHSLDENLGRVRAELEALGLAEDTLIIYTSDHGSHFRTRNGEYKRACHEGCIRVPLVARGPGFRGGRVVDDLVSLIDLPPTILAAAGVRAPETMRGRPVQALLDGPRADWPEDVFLQISESQVGRAIRTRQWKYSVYAPDKRGGHDASAERYVEEYLYDLERDPHERSNLVREAAYAGIRAEMAQRLIARMVAAGEPAPVILPAS